MKAKIMSLEDANAAASNLRARYHNRPNVEVNSVPVTDHDVPYGWVVQVSTHEYLRENGEVE